MTDCLLIGYPWDSDVDPFHMDIKSDASSRVKFSKEFNAAIAYLGTYLVRRGFSFDYVNSVIDEKEALIEKLKTQSITSVAISTTFCLNIEQIICTIKLIRKYSKCSKVIIGGPFIVLYTREMKAQGISSLKYILNKLNADFIIDSFQGEDSLVDILSFLKGKICSCNEIPNIYYYDNNEYLYTNQELNYIDLECNMVDWGLFKNKVGMIVPIRTSISCPYSCSFCTYPINAGKYRYVSTSAIEKELNSLKESGQVKIIHFVDDTLNIPKERFKEILNLLIKNNYGFKWYSYIRCMNLDQETVELMKQSGCIGVLLGIESANERMLQIMHKQLVIENYRKGIALLNKYDIFSFALFFFGFPGETVESVQETVEFIDEAKPTFYYIGIWHNDLRTPINSRKKEFDIKGDNRSWSHKTMNYSIAERLRDEALLKIQNSIPLSYYYSDIFQMLEHGFSIDEIRAICKERIKDD